jgi:hypothetical protein
MRRDNGALMAIAAAATLAATGLAVARATKGSRAVAQRTADGKDFTTEDQLSKIYHDENEDEDGWANLAEFVDGLGSVFYYIPSEDERKSISFIAGQGHEPAATLMRGEEKISTYGGFGSRPFRGFKVDKTEVVKAMLGSGVSVVPMLDRHTMLYKLIGLVYHQGEKSDALVDHVRHLIQDPEVLFDRELSDEVIERAFTHKGGTPTDVMEYLILKEKLSRATLSATGRDLLLERRAGR